MPYGFDPNDPNMQPLMEGAVATITPPDSIGAATVIPSQPPPTFEPPLPEPGPPPEPEVIPVDDLPKKIQDEIEAFAKEFCKGAREYVKNKEEDFSLAKLLYDNKVGIDEWAEGTWKNDYPTYRMVDGNIRIDSGTEKTKAPPWKSDYVHSPGYLVDQYVDHAYPAIFDGPDWLVVLPEQADAIPDDQQYPKALKLQQLLLRRLASGLINARMYEALQADVLYGAVYAKVLWYTKEHTESGVIDTGDPVDGLQEVEVDVQTYECPILQVIPPDKLLPDWKARHCDVQRWRAIGHMVDKPFQEIEAGFREGHYTLNEAEFKKRFSTEGAGADIESDDIEGDRDADSISDPQGWFTIWELHGKVPTSDGFKECVITLLTDRGEDDPTDGLMLRLRPRPILKSGRRPFVGTHFVQQHGVFGHGQIDRNKNLIFAVSQLIGQFQDNVRVTSNAAYTYDSDSPAAGRLEEDGWELRPGSLLPRTAGAEDPLKPIDLPPFHAQESIRLIEMFTKLLERRSFTPDTWQGALAADSATEAQIAQQQGAVPAQTRVDLFARNFVAPFATIALEMIREFSKGDQIVHVAQPDGTFQAVPITEDEMVEGEYVVEASVTRQDQTRVTKAQTLDQFFQKIPMIQQMLQMENSHLSTTELIKRFMDLLGIVGADRLVQQNPPPPMPQMGPDGMPMPGAEQGGGPPPGIDGVPAPETPAAKGTGANGGPMGPFPSDANTLYAEIQRQAQLGREGGQ